MKIAPALGDIAVGRRVMIERVKKGLGDEMTTKPPRAF